MMSSAQLIADSLVSWFAVIGLCLVVSFLARRDETDGLTSRLVFALLTVLIMLAARLCYWLTEFHIFQQLTLLAAALIPLAILITTEGLLRRHAAPAAKWALIGSTILLLLIAFPKDSTVEPWRSALLLGAQILACLIAAWMILHRDRQSLSTAENRAVARMTLSFLLILPLLATEFRDLAGWPVRMGGIAILGLCWLSISAGNPDTTNRWILAVFAILLALSLAVGLGAGSMMGSDWQDHARAIAVVMAGMFLMVIVYEWLRLRATARRSGLIDHLALGPMGPPEDFLKSIHGYPALEDALILNDADLSDFDPDLLDAAFQKQPVIWIGDLDREAADRAETGGQLESLFQRYDATHIMLISPKPRQLAVINAPSLAASAHAKAELVALQRMTSLMAKVEETT